MHRRNFDKQFFRQGKSIYLVEWFNDLCETEPVI